MYEWDWSSYVSTSNIYTKRRILVYGEKKKKKGYFFFQAEDGIRDKGMWLEFRRVLFRSKAGKYKLYGGSLFEPYPSPGTAGIIPKRFRIRKYKGGKFLGKDILGVADIPLMKSEVEAILPLGTEAGLVSKKYYFRYGGTKVPLDIFKVSVNVEKGLSKPLGKTLGQLSSSYSLPSYAISTDRKSVV